MRTGALRVALPAVALWLALGALLATITSHVADWYVMTDELLYERLALSIAQSGSPLPRVHGELIANINQLYPLLLAPLYHDRLVPAALHDAHILNAFLMTSAAVPAFLLTRDVTRSRALSWAVAAFSVAIPWITLSSFLLTEVVAYPAFLWAVLALHRSTVSPRPANDVLAVVAVAVAILARAQLAVLLVVLPLALFVHHLAYAEEPAGSLRRRVAVSARRIVSAHVVLAGTYAALAVTAILLAALGRLSSVLGTYAETAQGDVLPSGMGRSLLEHLAPLGLGLGILPFVVGAAWLLTACVGNATRDRGAFAAIALVTIVALLLEVTSYDLRFGAGRMHDRYLFYAAPLILIGLAGALADERRPRWSLWIPAGLLALGFSLAPLPRFHKFNVDSPVSALNERLTDLGGSAQGAQLLLGLGTGIVTALLFASVAFRRRRLVITLVALSLVTVPAQTAYAFHRLFAVDGTSGRPLTLEQGVVFDWIDRALGPGADVTFVPYPMRHGDYWASVAYAWNVEFWNASIDRSAVDEDAFSWTPETFPKTSLSFDRSTGLADVSPSEYAAESVGETRFHIAGTVRAEYRGLLLVQTRHPWRTDWMTLGLYRDGWTRPGVTARVRVFAVPGQTTSLVRYLTVSYRTPADVSRRSFLVSSNLGETRESAVREGASSQFAVCVPAHGFGDITLTVPKFSPIYGEPKTESTFFHYARSAGVQVTGIALADETRAC